jgi:Cu/Ag efflux protein CusF
MKNSYVLLSEQEINFLKNRLKNDKDVDTSNFISKIEYYRNLNNKENIKKFSEYKTLAHNKLKNFDAEYVNTEEFIVDDDAVISPMKDGAYVQLWMWVENPTNPKRTRKKTV